MSDIQLLEEPTPIATTARRTDVAKAAVAAIDFGAIDLATLALAKFGDWNAQVKLASDTLKGVQHDLGTQAKVDAAKSLRWRLIGQPVADARKVSKGLKSRLAATSKAVGEAEEGIVKALEGEAIHITPQIEAAEQRIADEKAERERIAAEKAAAEAARVKRIKDEIDVIRGMLDKAKHGTSVQIDKALQALRGLQFTTEQYAEFAAEAQAVRDATVTGLEVLCQAAQAREAEAARVEQQRIENERRAAELAEQQRQLDEQAAALKKQQEESEASRKQAEFLERGREIVNDIITAEVLRDSLPAAHVAPAPVVATASPPPAAGMG